MNARLVALLLVLAAALGASPAQAGRSCEQKPPDALKVQRSLTLAQHVAQQLDASGADVAVLARVGQDLSAYGQRYSHIGLAYRDGTQWRVAHKLNQCGTAQAAVYRQGLGEFFLDDLFDHEAGIAVLSPDVQARLLPVLRDNRRLAAMHTAAYSMVAYAWAVQYQQSNQWALETLAMAQDPAITNRVGAQSWLQSRGYTPSTLHLSAAKRLGARMSAANVAFDDHPPAKRFSDRIDTVTADSVLSWLGRSGLGERPRIIR